MRAFFRQLLSLFLAVVLLTGLLPQTMPMAKAQENNTASNELEGKTLSILGASISTYAGTSNGVAAETTNSTIGGNAKYYPHAVVSDVTLNDTWWMQVCDDMGLRLLVNNSWSGSSLMHTRNGTVGAYVDRCVQLHDDTGDNTGEEPDIIGIQMGTNDFQYFKDTLGTADIDYDKLITPNGDGGYTYATPVTSLEAAAIVLHKISVRYPKAEVYYLNISQRIDGTDELIRSFNGELKQVVEHFGAHIVDIYGSAITMDDFDTYIGDNRVHPNKLGMDVYTEAFKQALLEYTSYAVETHTVSMKLDGVTADYGDNKTVVRGDGYTVNLTAAAEMGLNVTVTMGGEDVTDSVYAAGAVVIPSVTDDVTITAKSVYEPKAYRWEFYGTDLSCISGGNVLTKKAGTTTDGVFSKTCYALANEVVLLHNLPWTLEWKCEGTFKNSGTSTGARVFTSDDVNANYYARYIFKSATDWIIAMGEKTATGSHNYGIALADFGIDGSELHTYRLENCVAEDGSNMIYLSVDGVGIGPMNNYYVGTTDKNTTSDWLSGKDFVFPYMGTDTHGFTNASIDYIQVTECAHCYKNGVCTACGTKRPSMAGKTISILGDSISTFEGVSNNKTYNSTLSGGAVYYTAGKLGVNQQDTWWQQTIDALGMKLLVNNSWSGSSVLHTRRGTEGAYVDRCVQLHNDKTGEEPDIIVVYMGGNDFNYYQDTLGTADIDYDALIVENADGTFTYGEPVTTCEAYAVMLHKMKVRYPEAEIYCMTSTPRRDPDKEDGYEDVGQPTVFNTERKQIMAHFGCTVVDIENCGIPKEAEEFDKYIGDGRTHPNAEGMDLIAQTLIGVMLGQETRLCDVSGVYNNVTNDNSAAAAVAGMGYTATLTKAAGYSDMDVTVTMAGTDVTEAVYSDGVICIEAVTGDIVINAVGVREPRNFRWEIKDGKLTSVGETENPLTKLAGTVTEGVLDGARYRLAIPVELKHDRPWVLEWKCAEDWRGVVLSSDPPQLAPGRSYISRTNGGQLCFGSWDGKQYNNYGVDLSGLDDQTHTYRLENHIAADGSNMVWLYVDGTEAGSMNNYFIGSNSQNTTSDWINGKDFSFSYIGSDSTLLNNCALDYLQVVECDHDYENGICAVCGLSHPNLANFGGKVISVLGDSISTFAGYIPVADGFNLEHLARYPQDNLLTDVNETWWMQVVDALNAKLGINDSWRGATVSGAAPVTTGTTGENASMANLTRIQNLGSNGTPDVILFYGGTNDLAHVSKIGSFDASTAPSEPDLTTRKWDNLADGYVHTLLRLKLFYPDAQIVAMLPTYTKSYYSNEKLAQANAVLADICDHYGVGWTDLRDSGISVSHLPDGIHPDAEGMDCITEAVLETVLEQCELEAGENVVHSVTHKLTGAESSLGYYKGVSHGKPFVTSIRGEDVTVAVTMDGVDITDAVYADGAVAVPEVTGNLVITAAGRVKPVYEDHLRQLPETVCSSTDLWTVLEHDREYFYVDDWTVHSSGKVHSVTFRVSPGERLYATSFGASGGNGGTMNGIRVTFFSEDGVLISMGPGAVYTEFSANGYLTVPEDAVAVNIPMWNTDDRNEIYILSRQHVYENGVCIACGTEHPNLVNYSGKVISILGGSTCTFDGYIPVADGFNLTHRPRYPQSNLLTDVNDTWWMQAIAQLDAKLGINDSWAGSQVLNTLDSNSGDLGPDAAMASLTRILNLGANGTPDVILFYGAMNDIGRAVTLGSFDTKTAPAQVNLTATKWDDLADAYVAAIMRMQYFYPDARVVAMLPGPTAAYYTEAERKAYCEVLEAICDHYGVPTVDLSNCGLTVADMPDGTHPNAEGMGYITAAVLKTLLDECEMEAGENVVHSVTHKLTGAGSSLSYYKGVSDGKAFVTTITGEDVTVTVTMGGLDITDEVYSDGKITVPGVTGDVVITAKGVYNADGRLQQLPDVYCSDTNLWALLEPVNEYYTANGWGNNSNSNYSVTIPVVAGDRIWATSFGAAGTNGYSANGVRITWFSENDVLESLGRDAVYTEFAEYGYITVPEGAVALNVPMASNAKTWEIYILNREHVYENGICTSCGEDSVRAVRNGNTLSLSGELTAGTKILAACYNGDRFVGTKFLVWSGTTLTEAIPEGESVKLFFTDENWLPLRAPVSVE